MHKDFKTTESTENTEIFRTQSARKFALGALKISVNSVV